MAVLPAPFALMAQCFVSASLAVLFLQSGLDKVAVALGVDVEPFSSVAGRGVLHASTLAALKAVQVDRHGMPYHLSHQQQVVDRHGNLEWLKGHFAKTPFAPIISLLLSALTMLELTSALVCGAGFVMLVMGGNSLLAAYGVCLCMLTFLALFTGQRVAKDYAGAAALVPYMTFCVVALAVCTAAGSIPALGLKNE